MISNKITSFIKNSLIIILLIIIVVLLIKGDIHISKLLIIKKEVDLISVVNLILSFIATILIPLVFIKIIDEDKNIKFFLVSEIQKLINIADQPKIKLDKSFNTKESLNDDYKNNIMLLLDDIEIKINSIKEQTDDLTKYKSSFTKISTDITQGYLTYHKDITGGKLMNSTFTIIDDNFKKEYSYAHNKFITKLKKQIYYIHSI